MRILVLQNDPYSPAAMVGERITVRGGEMDVVHPMHGGAMPASPDGYDGALVLGGVMSANDDDKYAAMAPMRDLVRAFHAADKPLMGICLGAQIFARCFGKEVRRHSALELGYVPVSLTEQAQDDRLLRGLARRQQLMQFHEDTFDLPDGAAHLIAGEGCANQGFRIGRATYGFQCHFEATPAMVETWIGVSAASIKRHLGERAEAAIDQVKSGFDKYAADQRKFAETVSDRWLDLVAGKG
jgi:GMP synthase-like glutamine amidotransferase